MGIITTRKHYSADFKEKVALEAIRGDLTLAELAVKHSAHRTMIAAWKWQAIDGVSSTFSGGGNGATIEAARLACCLAVRAPGRCVDTHGKIANSARVLQRGPCYPSVS
mgnify:CR=1 FL=1